MGAPSGFAYEVRGDDVVITHHGAKAGVLRGAKAAAFLADVEEGDAHGGAAQLLMAKATGNYRHGNERTARQHPRNRG